VAEETDSNEEDENGNDEHENDEDEYGVEEEDNEEEGEEEGGEREGGGTSNDDEMQTREATATERNRAAQNNPPPTTESRPTRRSPTPRAPLPQQPLNTPNSSVLFSSQTRSAASNTAAAPASGGPFGSTGVTTQQSPSFGGPPGLYGSSGQAPNAGAFTSHSNNHANQSGFSFATSGQNGLFSSAARGFGTGRSFGSNPNSGKSQQNLHYTKTCDTAETPHPFGSQDTTSQETEIFYSITTLSNFEQASLEIGTFARPNDHIVSSLWLTIRRSSVLTTKMLDEFEPG
jgi:hypothetical protein